MEVTSTGLDRVQESTQRIYRTEQLKVERLNDSTKVSNYEANNKTTFEDKQEQFGTKEQEERFIKLIEEANGKIQDEHNEFQFSVHEQTKQILIKVVDRETKEIIKEFPPEKILDMIAKMCEVAGIFVDEKR